MRIYGVSIRIARAAQQLTRRMRYSCHMNYDFLAGKT